MEGANVAFGPPKRKVNSRNIISDVLNNCAVLLETLLNEIVFLDCHGAPLMARSGAAETKSERKTAYWMQALEGFMAEDMAATQYEVQEEPSKLALNTYFRRSSIRLNSLHKRLPLQQQHLYPVSDEDSGSSDDGDFVSDLSKKWSKLSFLNGSESNDDSTLPPSVSFSATADPVGALSAIDLVVESSPESLEREGRRPKGDSVIVVEDSFESVSSAEGRRFVTPVRERKAVQTVTKNGVSPAVSDDNDDIVEDKNCTHLLDSLYGNIWRSNKKEVLTPGKHLKKRNSDKSSSHGDEEIDDIIEDSQQSSADALISKYCLSPTKLDFFAHGDGKGSSAGFKSPPGQFGSNCDKGGKGNKGEAKKKKEKDSKRQVPEVTVNRELPARSVLRDKNSVARVPESRKGKGERRYTFLESLSMTVPAEQSDPSALIYRNTFKNSKDQLAAELFKLFNAKVFDNGLPADVPIEWSPRMTGTAGTCSNTKITRRTGEVERRIKITLSAKVVDSADRMRDTLIHEMCHGATWIVNHQLRDGHGKHWQDWAQRAMTAFPELPPIRTCHTYVINTKYVYKCTMCGYSIGRHSKSLKVDRMRCGYCYGKFEVLITKTNKSGERKVVPAASKKEPSAFALFVKENYSKNKRPELKHSDVMRLLGQKFASLKLLDQNTSAKD